MENGNDVPPPDCEKNGSVSDGRSGFPDDKEQTAGNTKNVNGIKKILLEIKS